MSRMLLAMLLVLLTTACGSTECTGDPSGSTESADRQQTSGANVRQQTAGANVRKPAESPRPDEEGADQASETGAEPSAVPERCEGEPWQTADEERAPPASHTACETDDDCVLHMMAGCCERFLVAVHEDFRSCLADRNGGALCRARCRLDQGPLPERSAACREGSCRIVVEGRVHGPVLRENRLAPR